MKITLKTDLRFCSFREMYKEWGRLSTLICKYAECYNRAFHAEYCGLQSGHLSDRCWEWQRLWLELNDELRNRYREAFKHYCDKDGYGWGIEFGDLLC